MLLALGVLEEGDVRGDVVATSGHVVDIELLARERLREQGAQPGYPIGGDERDEIVQGARRERGVGGPDDRVDVGTGWLEPVEPRALTEAVNAYQALQKRRLPGGCGLPTSGPGGERPREGLPDMKRESRREEKAIKAAVLDKVTTISIYFWCFDVSFSFVHNS